MTYPQRTLESDLNNTFLFHSTKLKLSIKIHIIPSFAIALQPKLIICDEPVSALDVSIQAKIINLLNELQEKMGIAYIFISHDLSVVKHIADRVGVMYLGNMMEMADTESLYAKPLHPYTQALLRSLPEFAEGKSRLQSLPGVVPGKYDRPQGCLLNPRCPYATDLCRTVEPELRHVGNRQVKCHTPLKAQGEPSNV